MLHVQMTSCGLGSAPTARSHVNSTSSGGTEGAAPAPPSAAGQPQTSNSCASGAGQPPTVALCASGGGQPPISICGMLHLQMTSSVSSSAPAAWSHVNSTGSSGTKGAAPAPPSATGQPQIAAKWASKVGQPPTTAKCASGAG